jgi:hypothetical protein
MVYMGLGGARRRATDYAEKPGVALVVGRIKTLAKQLRVSRLGETYVLSCTVVYPHPGMQEAEAWMKMATAAETEKCEERGSLSLTHLLRGSSPRDPLPNLPHVLLAVHGLGGGNRLALH